jgi:ATP-dependent protease ClpP protease subunit
MSEEEAQEGPLIWSRPISDKRLAIFYDGMIDMATIHGIVEELNSNNIENSFAFKDFVLFLSSGGGDATMINPFYNIFKPMGLHAIVGLGQASSAAFQIMMECKKKKMPVYIDPSCHVIVHRVSTQWVGEERYERIQEYNDTWVKTFETMFDKSNEYFLKKLDKESQRKYKDGLNLYLLGKNLIDIGVFEEFKHGVL